MNSLFGTSRLMPLTAGTSPNFLIMFLVDTAECHSADSPFGRLIDGTGMPDRAVQLM
jgi:hypothetical protein